MERHDDRYHMHHDFWSAIATCFSLTDFCLASKAGVLHDYHLHTMMATAQNGGFAQLRFSNAAGIASMSRPHFIGDSGGEEARER